MAFDNIRYVYSHCIYQGLVVSTWHWRWAVFRKEMDQRSQSDCTKLMLFKINVHQFPDFFFFPLSWMHQITLGISGVPKGRLRRENTVVTAAHFDSVKGYAEWLDILARRSTTPWKKCPHWNSSLLGFVIPPEIRIDQPTWSNGPTRSFPDTDGVEWYGCSPKYSHFREPARISQVWTDCTTLFEKNVRVPASTGCHPENWKFKIPAVSFPENHQVLVFSSFFPPLFQDGYDMVRHKKYKKARYATVARPRGGTTLGSVQCHWVSTFTKAANCGEWKSKATAWNLRVSCGLQVGQRSIKLIGCEVATILSSYGFLMLRVCYLFGLICTWFILVPFLFQWSIVSVPRLRPRPSRAQVHSEAWFAGSTGRLKAKKVRIQPIV